MNCSLISFSPHALHNIRKEGGDSREAFLLTFSVLSIQFSPLYFHCQRPLFRRAAAAQFKVIVLEIDVQRQKFDVGFLYGKVFSLVGSSLARTLKFLYLHLRMKENIL